MIHDFLHRFLDIWLDMAPWLLVGFALAFLCSYLLSERWLRRHLGGPGWLPILKASLVGLPLPICSCGVLVVGLALRKSGARKAPVCAFLASAPQAGTDALLPSWAILGPALTVLRFAGAFAAGVVSGALVRWFGVAQPPPHETPDLADDCSGLCACHHHDPDHPHRDGEAHHHEFADRRTRLRDAARYAFVHLPGELAGFLLAGVAVAAALGMAIPEDALAGLSLPVAYALAVLVGIPTYACSLAIIPVAAGLIAGGLSSGAAFVFMACAPTTHVAALLVLGRAFGWRATAAFVLGVALTAIAIGLLIDFPLAGLIHVPGLTAPDHAHSHAAALWALIPLAALLLNGALRTHRHHHPHA